MNILITGVAGFIGFSLAEKLLNNGQNVIGIDNNLRKIFFGKDGSTLWVKKNLQLNKNMILQKTNL